jgi:hypothetical protein
MCYRFRPLLFRRFHFHKKNAFTRFTSAYFTRESVFHKRERIHKRAYSQEVFTRERLFVNLNSAKILGDVRTTAQHL